MGKAVFLQCYVKTLLPFSSRKSFNKNPEKTGVFSRLQHRLLQWRFLVAGPKGRFKAWHSYLQ
jgi:hypothetical protein